MKESANFPMTFGLKKHCLSTISGNFRLDLVAARIENN